MRTTTLISIICYLICSQLSLGQDKIPDSLTNKSFEELKTLFFENISNDSLSLTYSDTYLDKAKKTNDSLKIAWGYLLASYINNFEDAIKYSDSIIILTQDTNDFDFPALGYMNKGYHYYNHGDESTALDLYMKAYEYAKINNNQSQQIEIKQFIGGLKFYFGDYKEALKIFKEQLEFIKKQPKFKEEYYEDYIIVLDDLARTYLRGQQADSALIFINEGLATTQIDMENDMYRRMLLTSGSSYFLLDQYDRALDSLNKLMPNIKNDLSLCNCLYYRAKIYEAKHDTISAIRDFKMIDSIYRKSKISFIELRNVYKSLFNYYVHQDNETEQLKSIKQLILVDSLLDQEFEYSLDKITKDFDLPELKDEKQKLENKLNDNVRKNKRNYILISLVLIISILLALRFYYIQRKYKNRYNSIMDSQIPLTEKLVESTECKKALDNIPEHVIQELLLKLKAFERDKKFLNNDLTLNRLSKQLGTNSTYLSKIINFYKEKSFSNYLNTLRINFAIQELKENKTLRNYTISAIAQEMGYNTSESFSKAFYKEKGLYPSYFIKELKKDKAV